MLNRHQSREVVIQALFNLDFKNAGADQQQEIYQYVLDEFYPEAGEDEYSLNTFLSVLNSRKKIDKIITETALNWPLNKIDPVDRNILRLGIFEMLMTDEVPPRVAMNEAIELAKTFGGKNSFKFVSGVLGTIYEVSEVESDEDREKNKKKSLDDLPVKKKYGALVFTEKKDGVQWALIYDIFGYWTLPKGGGDDPESSPQEIAQQTILEEIGIEAVVLDELGQVAFAATDDDKTPIKKEVTYFLAKTSPQKLKLDKNNTGLVEARWFATTEIDELKKYQDLTPLIQKGIKLVEEKYAS